MAKGLRASSKKANRSLLRQNVFGPVEAARKERLSAKLLELASTSLHAIPAVVKMAEEGHEGERKKFIRLFYLRSWFWKYAFLNLGSCTYTSEEEIVAQNKSAENNDVAKTSAGNGFLILHTYPIPALPPGQPHLQWGIGLTRGFYGI